VTTTTDAPPFPQHIVGLWTLASSMLHGGDEMLGTTKLFRTKGFLYDGRKIQLPMVSGNAVRGLWRRSCALAFLDAYLEAGGEPLSMSAFYYLTSGGALKKGTDSGALDLAGAGELRRLIPFVGLFGGAGLGRIQPGKLYVDEAIPVCVETVPLLRRVWPGVEDAATAGVSIRDLVEVHGYSRQDDAKNEHWHRYLAPAARDEARALIQRVEQEETAAPAGAPQQMRYENIELVTGTVLFHRWGFLWPATRDELAGLGAGLLRWAERPHVGGRTAVGHGNLLVEYRGVTPETRLLTDGTEPIALWQDQGPDDALAAHVRENLDAIRAVLGAL